MKLTFPGGLSNIFGSVSCTLISTSFFLGGGGGGAASIPTNDLVPPIRRTRNHHSLAFQIPMAGTDIYKSSFFPQTIRDWNLVTDSLITASECAVDSVTKFTSLVRARD